MPQSEPADAAVTGNGDWYLTTSSFTTYSARASHWYGEVGRDDRSVRVHQLVRVLNEDEAQRLSSADDWHWSAGDDTERFDNREDVTAAAVAFFHGCAQKGERLFLGRDIGALEERRVLAVKT